MSRTAISSSSAPAAIGPYSQAVKAGSMVFMSGQIPLDPATGAMIEGDISDQARRVFENLKAVCEAAGGSFEQVVRVGIFMTDLGHFAEVNAVMADYFQPPFPARATVQVSALPKGAEVEVDAIMVLD